MQHEIQCGGAAERIWPSQTVERGEQGMARKKEPVVGATVTATAAKRSAAAMAGVPFYGYAEIVDLAPGHIEAAVQANAALAKALERVNKELMGLVQSSMENATNAAKALFGARTLSDVVAVNSSYAKSTFDTLVA